MPETSISRVAVGPVLPPAWAVMVALPGEMPRTVPSEATVATEVSLEVQVIRRSASEASAG